jgi:DNA-binding transcriptional ArsR family regulator
MRLAFTPSDPDYLIVVPDYHPAYGLDDTTRAEVLRLVRVEGVSVKEAAAQFNVGQSTVYKWLSHLKGL